ncbi:thioredoxin domain-containing protein [Myxococcota bacterium]|nr:thioredoxin domain-containing protein [Myxococcota bacterium]
MGHWITWRRGTFVGRFCLLVLAAAVWACGEDVPLPEPSGHVDLEVGDAPARGPSDAPVAIVEFADFECPYCRAAAPVIRDLLAEFPEDLQVAFRHFPASPSMHPNALPAALAAECARRQGRFWEMADRLMASALDDETLRRHAREIGDLDLDEWDRCRRSEEARSRVQADLDLGRRFGVDVTPTFIVNGAVYRGLLSLPVFRRLVEDALAEAQANGSAP